MTIEEIILLVIAISILVAVTGVGYLAFRSADNNKLWLQEKAPFWWPDAQGFTIFAVLFIAGAALFYRMTHPSDVNDKMLETMLTILFSTALVAIINFLFGSSRGSAAKDDTLNKIALTPPVKPSDPTPAPVVVAWWSVLTDAEKATITTASATDPRLKAFIDAATVGKASVDDLSYVVAKNLITQARADVIKS